MNPPSASGTFGRWAPLIGYVALTFFLSSLSRVPGADRVPDYCLHAPEFMVLAILVARALSGHVLGVHRPSALLMTLAGGTGYGLVDEFHQSFVPGRDSSLKDAAVDAAATTAVVLALLLISRRARTKAGTDRPEGTTGTGAGWIRRWEGSGSEAPAGADTADGRVPDDSVREARRSGSPRSGPTRRPRIELVTREGCHLCDDGEAILARELGREGLTFRRIDVDTDPALKARLGDQVPVVLFDGVKRFKGRIDAARLRKLLGQLDRLRA